MSPLLRPATEADAPLLAAILGDWVEATPWMPRLHTRDEDRAFLGSLVAKGQVTVAVEDDRPCAFLGRDGTEIGQLYVAEGCRRRGIGRALLDHAKEASHELWLWCFEANRAARAFYEAEGFAEDHRTDGAGCEERLPDIRFLWRGEEVR